MKIVELSLFGPSLTRCFFFFFSFIFLSLENYGVRKLEAVFAILIATMAVSFAWMFTDTKPNMKNLFIGKDPTDRQLLTLQNCPTLLTH